MRLLPRFLSPACAGLLVLPALHAQFVAPAPSVLPPEPVRLDSLAAFQAPAANWQLAGGITGDPRHEKAIGAVEGTGVLVNNPRDNAKGHLVTAWEHGDLELDLDFLMTPGANSGVYLQSRYEVQLFDSWGKKEVTSLDCGAIYERWDDKRGPGKEGYEGHAPKANASRAPGLWQHLHVEFEAPRFDATGKKTKNARFAKVVLNDFVVQENVEVTGPTRSAAAEDEKPFAPLMIQGDHGPVAIKALAVKRSGIEAIKVADVKYKLYSGGFAKIGEYDAEKPAGAGEPARFAQAAVEKSGKFALVFNGSLTVPRAGGYAFSIETSGIARLSVDGKPVVLPLERGTTPGVIDLTAGAHAFRLDFIHTSAARPMLELVGEGPGIAKQTLTVREREQNNFSRARPTQPLDVKDRVLAQRSFVPYEPRKRLYAINIGTPAGVHFSYDFETGAILRVWRGAFLDTADMWINRGEPQLGRPAGPALTLNAKPSVALLEFAQAGDWPTEAEPLWSSQGYALEPDGLPIFQNTLSGLKIRDRIAPTADGRGLTRRIEAKGDLTSWSTWVLLAEGSKITRQPDGGGWIIGDREWYLDWPADATVSPVVRTRGDHQQLAVPITKATVETPIVYTLIW